MPKTVVEAAGHRLEFGDVTHVMGVINLSPESRNQHTVVHGPSDALELARRYRESGTELVDVGGQSSHFESPTLEEQAEIDRLCPTVEALAGDGFVVSVDTWKPVVAEAAISSGAAIVNDTGGLRSGEMRSLVERSQAAVVVVHVDGAHPHDVGDVVLSHDKAARVAGDFDTLLQEVGPSLRERTILDPGIAINYRGDYDAYTRQQLQVIRASSELARLGRPVLMPIPRKAEAGRVAAYIALSLEYGADMIRVHDVDIAVDLVRLWDREVRR